GTLPQVVIERAAGQTWFGAGGEVNLQALRVGSRGWRNAPLSMGAGRAKSSCEGSTGDTFGWRNKARCRWCAKAGGMQRERAAGSLAKMCGTTTHILRAPIVDNHRLQHQVFVS